MEKRIGAIEDDIRNINSLLIEYAQTNAVIAKELETVNKALNRLADNQSILISLKTTIENITTNCRDRGKNCHDDFDEIFERLRTAEGGLIELDGSKISSKGMGKCKEEVILAAKAIVKPVKDDVKEVRTGLKWVVSVILGSIIVAILKHLFWPSSVAASTVSSTIWLWI